MQVPKHDAGRGQETTVSCGMALPMDYYRCCFFQNEGKNLGVICNNCKPLMHTIKFTGNNSPITTKTN